MDKDAVKEVTALLQELVSDIACEEKRQRGELARANEQETVVLLNGVDVRLFKCREPNGQLPRGITQHQRAFLPAEGRHLKQLDGLLAGDGTTQCLLKIWLVDDQQVFLVLCDKKSLEISCESLLP